MNSFWWTLGKILNGGWFYDNIGDIANWIFIGVGAFGMLFWLNWQRKFNQQAEKDPNQIK